MYFKKIEMHGFKSFAEPVVIEFHQGITCIVGPNGSGKSNISDAIRWVLGEQSPKMLRGGKMEEVIFSGTDSRKSRGMAEVTLVIDNQKGSLPIDYKEVAITRRMFRSGESEYRINGNQCRLRDIRELIMDTGIGVDGYSIIGQGKISDILSNKTESRREIFEEAAGIVQYRTKKAESERKLAATGANMERVSDIIGELEGRLGGLERDSIKAREYLSLRDRHRELEINITLKNIENLRQKNEYIQEDIAELQGLMKKTEERKTLLERELSESSSRNQSLEGISAETRQKLMEVIDRLNAAVNKEQLDKERLMTIEENEERINEEIRQLEEKKSREEENEKSCISKKADIEKTLKEQGAGLRDRIDVYTAAEKELKALEECIDNYKNDIFELSGAINSDRAEMTSLQRLEETLDKRRDALIKDRDSGRDSNKEVIDSLNRLKAEKAYLDEELEDVSESISTLKASSEEVRQQERSLSKETERLRISLGQLSARMKTIEEMESNYEGYNYAVKHIMKSSLPGINGVVAELIRVPSGYETAIETALGGALQNIVCEKDEDAKRAIQSLKDNRAGRMTFLPVSSVKGRKTRDTRLEKEQGFIGFGPECIEYHKKYRGIMDYLLGRVVLVDNMDNALRLSKIVSEFRFVTLDGDVINARGAITGGRYKNKTANILDRKAEIEALRQRTEADRKKISDNEGEQTLLRDKLSHLDRQLSDMELKLREKQQQVIFTENEIKMTEALLKDIRTSGDKLSRELETIACEKDSSRLMIQEIEDRIEKNQYLLNEAKSLGEEQQASYEKRKSEFDRINNDITAAKIEVNNREKEKEHLEVMLARTRELAEEIRRDIHSRKQQLQDMRLERTRLTSAGSHMETAVRAGEAEKRALEEQLEQITAEREALSDKRSSLDAEKEELSSRLSGIHNQKYELEIKKARNETQLDTYKNKIWDDFGISYIQAMDFKSEDFVMSLAVKENRQLKNRINELGEVNVGAIEEYETVKERYDFLMSQKADIQEAIDALTVIIGDMDKTIRSRFKESFDRIVINFEEKFRELFGGGHAELRLSDERDPLGSSIDIVAQPPGKRLQNISLLSGGEKTLTAIALMFAVLAAKPTPFCILDEVEAALDDANIDRFIGCLRKFTGIQFTLVTHQKATMEHAEVLYGVTMPEKGVSKVISLHMDDNFDI